MLLCTEHTTVEHKHNFCMRVQLLRSCPLLCDPMDCSPPGSSVHGIFQTRILEWVAISFSRQSSQPRDQTHISSLTSPALAGFFITQFSQFSSSVVSDSFATPRTVARQASLSMGFSRQEYWSGLPFPSPGNPPDSGIGSNPHFRGCKRLLYH